MDEVFVSGAKIASTHLIVELSDGRELATPLAWYPRLQDASADDLLNFEVSPDGIHWDRLDEDLSLEGMLHGRPGVRSMSPKPETKRARSREEFHAQTFLDIGHNNAEVDFPALTNNKLR